MTPEFSEYSEGFGATLQCPNCKNDFLHHESVEIFECGEDATQGLHLTIEDMQSKMDMSLEGNPSPRRNGLTIKFSCETCNAIPVLTLFQHKGITYTDFTFTIED